MWKGLEGDMNKTYLLVWKTMPWNSSVFISVCKQRPEEREGQAAPSAGLFWGQLQNPSSIPVRSNLIISAAREGKRQHLDVGLGDEQGTNYTCSIFRAQTWAPAGVWPCFLLPCVDAMLGLSLVCSLGITGKAKWASAATQMCAVLQSRRQWSVWRSIQW